MPGVLTITSFIRAYPAISSGLSGFASFSIGDIFAQYVDKRQVHHFDVDRAVRIGCLGLMMNGIVLHRWYQLLDVVYGPSMNCKLTVLKKTIADQLVYAPGAIVAFFMFTSTCIDHAKKPHLMDTPVPLTTIASSARNEGGSDKTPWSLFSKKMEESFLTTFAADCSVWPLANVIQFRFVPLQFRTTYMACCQLMWQTYMSFTAAK